MAKRIYVGNLAFTTTSDDVRLWFEAFGPVRSAHVQVDKATGRSRGFGFVLMESDADADNAINGIDGTDQDGRRVNVNEAQARPAPSPPGREGPGRSAMDRGGGGGRGAGPRRDDRGGPSGNRGGWRGGRS